MRLVLGSMTGWVGFALRTKTFNVLPGRPAATERGGHGTRGGWRDKIEADNSNNSARCAEAKAASFLACRQPQQFFLQCCKSLYFCAGWRLVTEDKERAQGNGGGR